MWAAVSIFLGLGFTFFSGAMEAWIVDGLKSAKYDGNLDDVFAKGSIASGFAMLTGTVTGGVVAQYANLGVPYILRVIALGATFAIAFFLMHDEGFKPKAKSSFLEEVRDVASDAFRFGVKNAPIRWIMLSSLFSGGVGIFGFYAMQPYLLELYGDPESFAIAGISAAVVAGAQIVGGLLVPYAAKVFQKRTTLLLTSSLISVAALIGIGFAGNFWLVLVLLAVWAIVFSVFEPVREAYINGIVPTAQRATLISADNLMISAGGAVTQPALGKTAEVWGYPASYLGTAIFQFLALPFLLLARRENAESDDILKDKNDKMPADPAAPQE